jgi:hypothetical protein
MVYGPGLLYEDKDRIDRVVMHNVGSLFAAVPAKHPDQYYVISFALAFVLTLGAIRAWDKVQRRRIKQE